MRLTQLLAAACLAQGFAFDTGALHRSVIASRPPRRVRPPKVAVPGSRLYASGGFGGGTARAKGNKKKGKGGTPPTPAAKKMSPRAAQRAQRDLLERYGGDVAAGTQARVDAALMALDPPVREAAELYATVARFAARVAPMTPADRRRLVTPEQEREAAEERERLQALLQEGGLSARGLHNVYQRCTWDAAADAKATQADVAGHRMKADLQSRVDRACAVAVAATEGAGAEGKLLDVGCGHGALVPTLAEAGLAQPDMYVGIDLSPEMVDQAVLRYGAARNGRTGKGRTFVAGDFLDARDDADLLGDDGSFDAVLLCSTLHDLPDAEAGVARAAALLRAPGGKLVVVHAQGAGHVLGQHRANPVLVRRGLPTAQEWEGMVEAHPEWGLALETGPAAPGSDREMEEGYLAVLSKI